MAIGLFFGIDKNYVYMGKISPLWYVGKMVIIVVVDIVNTVRKGQYV